jgi:hypothetical protein
VAAILLWIRSQERRPVQVLPQRGHLATGAVLLSVWLSQLRQLP